MKNKATGTINVYSNTSPTVGQGQDIESFGAVSVGDELVLHPTMDASYIRFFMNSMNGGQVQIWDNNTVETRLKMLEADSSEYTSDLICWGDSITAGAGGSTPYPEIAASILGISCMNCGVGGESANTIAARQGGNNIIIPAGSINGTYSSFNDIFGHSIAPLLQGSGAGSASMLYINDKLCNISYSDSTYTISNYSGDSSSVPLIGRFIGSTFNGRIVVIMVGQNGAWIEDSADLDSYVAVTKSMISHVGHERWIVMGLTTGTTSSRSAMELRYLQEFGNKFLPSRKLLVEQGLTLENITPTSQDTTDISNGTVPTSLRADSTHLNTYGYHALGTILANKITSLGYLD